MTSSKGWRTRSSWGSVAVAGACATLFLASAVHAQPVKSYDSTKKDFWEHPPADWFLGDETEAQKGLAPPAGPALPTPMADLEKNLKAVKLPKGFKISVYAAGVNSARQMAWGDKGTLFVGSFGAGTVYAITDKGGKKEVKSILTGLKMPTGLAFRDGALYVVDIDKILKYDDAEANLDKMPTAKVVYDDMPSYGAHGWKYLTFDRAGWLYVPFGPPCNECLPPTSLSQVRRVNPATGQAELIAIGVRNSVGGDIDPRSGATTGSPRTRATGSATTCRATSSITSPRSARTTAIRTATRATCPIRSTRWATSARSSRRRP